MCVIGRARARVCVCVTMCATVCVTMCATVCDKRAGARSCSAFAFAACVLKVIEGVLVLRSLASLDIFLIDWEVPSHALPSADAEQHTAATT